MQTYWNCSHPLAVIDWKTNRKTGGVAVITTVPPYDAHRIAVILKNANTNPNSWIYSKGTAEGEHPEARVGFSAFFDAKFSKGLRSSTNPIWNAAHVNPDSTHNFWLGSGPPTGYEHYIPVAANPALWYVDSFTLKLSHEIGHLFMERTEEQYRRYRIRALTVPVTSILDDSDDRDEPDEFNIPAPKARASSYFAMLCLEIPPIEDSEACAQTVFRAYDAFSAMVGKSLHYVRDGRPVKITVAVV